VLVTLDSGGMSATLSDIPDQKSTGVVTGCRQRDMPGAANEAKISLNREELAFLQMTGLRSKTQSDITARFDFGERNLYSPEQRLKTLFVAGLAGDTADYCTFLTELALLLRGYHRKRIPQLQDEVEDLMQETLLAVHNARSTYRPDEPLTAWVHSIARYKLMDFFRTRARRESLQARYDEHSDIFAEAANEPGHARRDIGKLLDNLPDKQRMSILHVKLHGHSVAEAAELTGLSESAVRVSIHRGLKALALHVRGVA
jgi:RNA polymerase sigma-70 factor (ECF subfamily)